MMKALPVNDFVRLSIILIPIKLAAKWPRQESNLDLELRKLLYYPLYYEAVPCFRGGKFTGKR